MCFRSTTALCGIPHSGGLSQQARAKREQVRFEAADMFERGLAPPEVARRLRVTRASACSWKHGGSGARRERPGPQQRISAGCRHRAAVQGQ
ncbi:helix-turn-helix domain-containing protein [Sphaerisporangium sp. NPDC088356]|uniref:helix-turn-helix domain-containing protein n=1 Tax=Sphaerisporangium sp. NPDC088356 TaxID=3154871 RepID=UPI0034474A7E